MNFKKSFFGYVLLSSTYFGEGYAQTLQEAVQATLNENPEIQEARAVRMAYEQEIGQAASKYLPTLDVSAGYGLEQANNFNTRARGLGTNQVGRTESTVQMQQMIFDGFLTPHEVDRFTAKTDAQAYTVYGKSEIIGLQAAQAYINVLRRQALFELASANLSLHKGFYEQIKMRTQRGIGRISDLDQATGRLARAESNLQSEQGNLKDAQTSYLRVTGILPNKLAEVPIPTKALPASLEEATELALAYHPTLKSANSDIEESLAQHNSASAPFYPKVNFVAEYDNNENVGGIRGPTEDLIAMARVSYNLFNGGKDTARRNQTAYEMYQAKNIRDNTYRQVVESIRLSWVAYKTVGSQLEFFKAHRDSSTKALNAYKQQFNIGQRTLLDLLDSTNEMYLANVAYTDAKYTELTARYRILAGMGRLNNYLGTTLPNEVKPLTPDKKVPGPIYTASADPISTSDSYAYSYQNASLTDIEPNDNALAVAEVTPLAAAVQAEPTAAPKTDTERAIIIQRLYEWAAAWSRGDVDQYLDFYNDAYSADTTINHAAWRKSRIDRISPDKKIAVSVSYVTVEPDYANHEIITKFHQTYRSKNYQDETEKRIVWHKENSRWLIREEKSIN